MGQENVYFGTEPHFRRHPRRGILQPFAAAADRAGGAALPSPGDDRNVEATMTKGDHMAAKHIPRTLRPALVPYAVFPTSPTEQLL